MGGGGEERKGGDEGRWNIQGGMGRGRVSEGKKKEGWGLETERNKRKICRGWEGKQGETQKAGKQRGGEAGEIGETKELRSKKLRRQKRYGNMEKRETD